MNIKIYYNLSSKSPELRNYLAKKWLLWPLSPGTDVTLRLTEKKSPQNWKDAFQKHLTRKYHLCLQSTQAAEPAGLVTVQPHFSWCHSCQGEGSTKGRHLCGDGKTIRHHDSTTLLLVIIELAPLSPCLSQKSCCLFHWGPTSSTGGSRDHEYQPLKMIIDGFVSNT